MKSRELKEASPDTLPGSFTDDLVKSKQWICNYLKLIQQKTNQPFNNITILGSWYGNLGILLDQNKIDFKNLILIDIEKDKLDISKTLLGNLNYYKIFPLVRDANDHVYGNDENQCIINTSCNDIENRGWFDKIPAGCLVVLQARNNLTDVPIITDNIYDFDDMYPMQKTLVLKQMPLTDPSTDYNRFMKIGIK